MSGIREIAPPSRGVLNPRSAQAGNRVARYAPSAPLQPFVEHHWTVRWDLRGKPPFIAETLPYPSVHLVFEEGKTALAGVPTGRFVRELTGLGRVVATKFRPGGFFPFWQKPLSGITDVRLTLRQAFDVDGARTERRVLEPEDDLGSFERVEALLLARLPEPDANVELVNRVVDSIAADRDIARVEDVAALLGKSPRALQRLFSKYVGVSPKWVIQRFRLHEAAEQLKVGERVNLSRLAQELGYFDQAHFQRHFKALVGRPPAEFAAQVRRA